MSGPKVVIIVLIVLAVLFALVLVAGAGGGRETSADTEGSAWARLLKKLHTEERLKAGDVNAPCLQGQTFVLAAGAPCAAVVRESDEHVRTATVRLAQGGRAELSYAPSPGEKLSVPVRVRLKSGGDAKLQIMSKGGTLTLVCLSGAGTPPRCLVALE